MKRSKLINLLKALTQEAGDRGNENLFMALSFVIIGMETNTLPDLISRMEYKPDNAKPIGMSIEIKEGVSGDDFDKMIRSIFDIKHHYSAERNIERFTGPLDMFGMNLIASATTKVDTNFQNNTVCLN